ncbi:TPA: protein TolR [Legionella pneumophila]|uniref:Tol-Pal system protein TolR n=5 Tax=Gammaproteobacteria TaxID=1236 RepID=Q5ZV67_LEGPH|nr:protein TolR [Legionella pneumophila]ERH42522.1 biopolymer transporter ExbD [Legionella pneumophila str. Leg01/11]ERH46498.1 biopolymer transporter ExbD [Legionella pneumophila str. Leg01/53]ERI46489.1 biopolymer transporter ExbD [Legionella pneumophila str. Leg01/20]AAU27655.1 biopolymer transport protein TolR [Legionella pneumophila subsp. pneumophila str. Philadelphia 1]ABQ54970.1 biopolymer transport protein TolR [Legionella pneumophila str. Corby]
MNRSKTNRERPISEINVVPYIDVMLVLLVIFMITAPMLTQGVTVDLPKAASQTLQAADREPIIVSVNQLGSYFLNISSTPAEPIEAQALLVRVAAELELAKQSGQKLNVLVKGDQGVAYGKVVQAMALLKQAGAEQVGLLTDSQTGDEGQA